MTWNQAPGVLKREAATQGPDLEADDHGGIAESVRLTEIVLAGFWREALGLKEVDLHDDFFELGGDSARALQVIKSINQSFVLDLSVSELIQNPTIEKLATVCDRETYGKPDPKLIQLAPGRDEGTLYIMDVRAGLCRLGQRLGDSGLAILGTMTPLAMFHPGSESDATEKLPTLQELAAPHTALILGRHSSGPCFLAGHSIGGLLAFEVAHQLQRQGRQVETIFLLDSWAIRPELPPRWKRLKGLTWARVLGSFKFHTGRLWARVRAKLAPAAEQSRPTPNLGDTPALAEAGIPRPLGDEPWEIWKRLYVSARIRYSRPQLDGRAVLLRSQDKDMAELARLRPDFGWAGLFAHGLRPVDIPGDHLTMLKEPQLSILVSLLKEGMTEPSAGFEQPRKPSPSH